MPGNSSLFVDFLFADIVICAQLKLKTTTKTKFYGMFTTSENECIKRNRENVNRKKYFRIRLWFVQK